VLPQVHATQLGERLARIVERADDHLPLVNRQREHPGRTVIRLELLGEGAEAGLAGQPYKLEDVSIGDGSAGGAARYSAG